MKNFQPKKKEIIRLKKQQVHPNSKLKPSRTSPGNLISHLNHNVSAINKTKNIVKNTMKSMKSISLRDRKASINMKKMPY